MIQTIYFKQAWQLLKQNKLFSGLYIAGTGLAIAMVMVVAVVYYVKIAPIYPETERMRTYYLEQVRVKNDAPDGKGMLQWSASYTALQEWFYPLKNVEVVSAVFEGRDESAFVQPADLSGDFPVAVKYTDPAFFRIYSFRFLEGKSFAQADLESGIRSVPFLNRVWELLKRWGHGNRTLHVVATLPLLAIATLWAFQSRRRLRRCPPKVRFNLMEHFFIQAYIAGQIMLISILLLPIGLTAYADDLFALPWWVLFLLFWWDFRQLYLCSWWESFWRTLLMFVYALLLLVGIVMFVLLLIAAAESLL